MKNNGGLNVLAEFLIHTSTTECVQSLKFFFDIAAWKCHQRSIVQRTCHKEYPSDLHGPSHFFLTSISTVFPELDKF